MKQFSVLLAISLLVGQLSWAKIEEESETNASDFYYERMYFVNGNQLVFNQLFSVQDSRHLSTLPLCFSVMVKEYDDGTTKLSNLSGSEFDEKLKAENKSALDVSYSLQVLQLVNLDEKSQTVSLVVSTNKYWFDCRLRWNVSKYWVTQLEVAPTMFKKLNIFTPSLRLLEALNPGESADAETETSIFYDGSVLVMKEYLTTFSCGIDVTLYPFDIQQCNLTFESVLSENFINLKYFVDDAETMAKQILGRYTASDQWSLVVLPAIVSHRNACTLQERFCVNEGLIFKLIMRRNPNYQLLNLFFPAFFIVVISSCVFVIPPGAGDKMGLSVSILLSLYMFSQLMYDKMPESNAFPLLSQYFLVCIALVTASCVYSALSAVFASASPSPPPRVRKLIALLGPIFIFDLLKKRQSKQSEPAKFEDGEASENFKQEHAAAESNDAGKTDDERDINSYCVDKPETLTWAAFGALLDRLFFVVHFLATFVLMAAYLIHGYIPWSGYSVLNLNEGDKRHVCAQLASQGAPANDIECPSSED